jgi:hypothetical protein
VSAKLCIAVGFYESSSGVYMTLAEQWNGTEWVVQSTPNPSGATESFLQSVSCPSTKLCVATGIYKSSAGTVTALAEKWNGTEWVIQSVPAPSGAQASELNRLSCVSTKECIAVGRYKNSVGTYVTLAEKWNGTEWATQATPNPAGATASDLYGVSCSSSTACTAVNYYLNASGTPETLAERWNGTEWVVQYTPNPSGAQSSSLYGVSCASATSCTAVGDYENSAGIEDALAESWNGTEWTIEEAQISSGSEHSALYGISCTLATACTAAGENQTSTGTTNPLIEESV